MQSLLLPFRSASYHYKQCIRKLNSMDKVMKAIVVEEFGGPEVMLQKTVPKLTPQPDECLIRVEAVGVNPVDTYLRSGAYPKLPDLPYTPGKDGAGIVEAVGEGLGHQFKEGDRVFFVATECGAYAQYTRCKLDHLYKLPDNVTFEEGACLGVPAFTAYRALFEKTRAQPGERVFIHGASGGVGMIAVQMARAAGMEVVGTAGTPTGIERLLKIGCSAAFNHKDISHVKKIKAAYPNGFDVCLEMLASTNLRDDLPLMNQGGRIAIIGSRGYVEINPRDIMMRELQIYGVALGTATKEQLRKSAAYICSALRDGTLHPIVSAELPLERAGTAHIEVMSRSSTNVGNIVLKPFL